MSHGENSMEKRCWENLSSKYAPNKRGIKTTSFIDTWYFCNKYNVTNTFDSTKKRDSFSQAMRQKGWCFTLSGDQPPAHHNKGSWRQSISRPAWVKIYTLLIKSWTLLICPSWSNVAECNILKSSLKSNFALLHFSYLLYCTSFILYVCLIARFLPTTCINNKRGSHENRLAYDCPGNVMKLTST